MRFRRIVPVLLVVGVLTARTTADTFKYYHEASGWGVANVFDGGPPVWAEAHTDGPADPSMVFGAVDHTQPGSQGATADASFASLITESTDSEFAIRVDLDAAYTPSLFPGGDNPGGMAEGRISSVIEFVMPADELTWYYQLLIDETGPFHGTTHIVVENVTHPELLMELSSQVYATETTLSAEQGDLIRIASSAFGAGSMGPGTGREYWSSMAMAFVTPEPVPMALMTVASLLVFKRRRAR